MKKVVSINQETGDLIIIDALVENLKYRSRSEFYRLAAMERLLKEVKA